MKASSNQGGIKNLLLQHVEKIVLGVAVVLVALFLWSAMGVKPIDESKYPEKLLAAATFEKERIQKSTPPPSPPSGTDTFEKHVVAGLGPVAVTPYVHPQQFSPPIQPPLVKRPEPTLLPVEDLRATATVISIPEVGEPPVWKEPEKEKKKAKKKKAGFGSEKRIRRRGKGQPAYPDAGYGQAGYGQTGQPGYGGAGGDIDRSAGGKAGYGIGPLPGHGAGGYGGGGYGAPARRGEESREGAGGGYGAAGYGAGAMLGERPGVPISGQLAEGVVYPAVVLTGRVPFEKQFDEFQKKFKEAARGEMLALEQDTPQYMRFKVERQEVGNDKWVEVDLDEAMKSEAQWATSLGMEQVDPTYLDPYLAWPMPPTIGRDWGRLESHPSIPFAWMAPEVAPTAVPRTEELAMIRESRMMMPSAVPGAEGYGGYGEGRGGYGAAVGAANEFQPLVAPTPYKLFRFVDTQKLEPGKEYRYRVSLELQNPNFMMDPALLEEAASSQRESRWTPPAESPTVTIPGKSFVYALSAKPETKSAGDDSGQVLFHVWSEKMGAEIAKEFDLTLGAIADFVSTVENWYNPYTGMGEKLDNVHFSFKEGPPMLADVTGGEKLPGVSDVKQPAEMLFIDAQGRLLTSNQMGAAAAAEFYKERYDAAPPPEAETELAPEQPRGLLQPPGYGGKR